MGHWWSVDNNSTYASLQLYVCPKLALLGLALGPPVGFVAYKFADYLSKLTEKQYDALAAAGQVNLFCTSLSFVVN